MRFGPASGSLGPFGFQAFVVPGDKCVSRASFFDIIRQAEVNYGFLFDSNLSVTPFM